MDEQQLIDGCVKRKSKAQKALYDAYAPLMMSVCIRYVRDRDRAQDVLQDGFVKVFTKIDTYNASGQFGGWMRRIFVTTALEHLRSNKRFDQDINIDDREIADSDFDNSILEKISADYLLEHIARLPDGYRTVFNLFGIEGYTHREIAAMLGIEESTSRSQYNRARKLLQNSLQSFNRQKDER